MFKGIQEKAMLVKLSISQWSARKYDRKPSDEIADKYGASHEAGRYNKVLVAKEEIKKIQKVSNEARTFHYENTLPWGDNGERILPSANYLNYTQKVREFEQRFFDAVRAFIGLYPALIMDAQIMLNGLFNQSDYPDVSDIDRKFAFSVQVNPIPNGQDFRVNLQSAEIERIQGEIESRVKTSTQIAINDLWDRLHTNVSHMVDKLSDTEAVFRDSLINNLIELVELLPRLNLTDDPNIEAIRKDVENKLCSFQPQILREDGKEREKAAKEAQGILDAMSGYIGK